MKYVALLRGINVGGNSLVKMSDLKFHFEKAGLSNIVTYINSGNVIFETSESSKKDLSKKLEKIVEKECNVSSKILLKTKEEIEQVIKQVPKEWNLQDDLRCYIAYLFDSVDAEDAIQEIKIRKGVDSLKTGPGVLYMTTRMSERTKSAFNKLAGTNLYKEMTIRNYNTTKKILELFNR